ncbi:MULTISPECIES: type II toxin-antitoxin system RelE/ParE family toxin [unclassified Thiocapsa]|uniref:type II toxin-antitoxin system RelE/ParE family toxin n=1 Tax=unclassified Thiocapsa TaxID=2641286 RepID=UPI0035B05B32
MITGIVPGRWSGHVQLEVKAPVERAAQIQRRMRRHPAQTQPRRPKRPGAPIAIAGTIQRCRRTHHSSSIDYNAAMYIIKRMPDFDRWLDGLRDHQTRIRLLRRLEKAQRGLLGDVAAVGDGVFEMRECFGPGWRMDSIQRGTRLIVMLGGGDKNSQAADIVAAKTLAANIGE